MREGDSHIHIDKNYPIYAHFEMNPLLSACYLSTERRIYEESESESKVSG